MIRGPFLYLQFRKSLGLFVILGLAPGGVRATGADSSARDDRTAMLDLVSKLNDASKGEAVASQLEELVKSKASLRTALVEQLKPIIRAGPTGGKAGWINSIKVTGDLKLVELSPDLAAWVDRPGSSFFGVLPQYVENPAGTALAKMGDAALPALVHMAETGTPSQRGNASMFIAWIGTPAARRALRSLLKKETDPKEKERLKLLLKAAKAPRNLG